MMTAWVVGDDVMMLDARPLDRPKETETESSRKRRAEHEASGRPCPTLHDGVPEQAHSHGTVPKTRTAQNMPA
jgi:hypothetical protein